MFIGSNDADFEYPLKFVTNYYRQRDFTLGVFLGNICVSKMSIIVNFDLDLKFHAHLLQEFDGQIQCDHFGENLMKIG